MTLSDEELRQAAKKVLARLLSPYPILEETIEQKRWLSGIIVATAFFEIIGLHRLKEQFKERISGDRFQHLTLEQIILVLHASGIIDQPTYSRMMEVREVRNKIVHNPTELDSLKDSKAKRLIESAIGCLKTLAPRVWDGKWNERSTH